MTDAANRWRAIVEAVWTMNYVSTGFKGVLPRLQNLSRSLDELDAALPLITKRSTAEILEREIRLQSARLQQVKELLDTGTARMTDLLSRLERSRVELREDKNNVE